MKKTLSILLALLLLLSLGALAACAKEAAETPAAETPAAGDPATPPTESETPPADPTTPPAESAPAESEPAGEEIDWANFTLGISTGSLSDSMMLAICDGMQKYFENLGAEAPIVECNFVPNVQLEQLENFVTMQVDAIYCLSLNSVILEDVTQQALDQGIKVIFGGVAPTYRCTAAHNCDNTAVGNELGKMILGWLDKVHPDAAPESIHVAAFISLDIEALRQRGEEMVRILEEDPRCKITYTKEGIMVVSEGFDAAQEALTADPDIRVFACFNDNTAVGASNYLMSANLPDLDQYGAFGSAISEVSQTCVDDTAAGNGALRGLITYGTMNPADGAIDCVYKAITGVYKDSYVAWDVIETYNNFAYTL